MGDPPVVQGSKKLLSCHASHVFSYVISGRKCAWVLQEDGKWNKFGGRLAWDKSYICNNNPSFGGTGSHKTQEDYVAAPNLDHSQERVRNDIKAWLKWLRNNVGFDGWRFDFVKGYGRLLRMHVEIPVGTCLYQSSCTVSLHSPKMPDQLKSVAPSVLPTFLAGCL